MVVIRLARKGAKKNPFYHIVAADSRYPRDGRYIEQLGYFNPTARGNEVRLQMNQERITHWVQQGAQTSERLNNLIKEYKQGVKPSAIPVAEYKKAQAEISAKAATQKAAPEAEATAAEPTAAQEPAAAPEATADKPAAAAEPAADDAAKAPDVDKKPEATADKPAADDS